MNEMTILNLLGLMTTVASRLEETATEGDRGAICQILGVMLNTEPVFERVALAFRSGSEVPDTDLAIVHAVLRARIHLDTAITRLECDALDQFASDVDAALGKFEDAIFMLGIEPEDFKDCYEGSCIPPCLWWGLLLRDDVNLRSLLEHSLQEVGEQRAVAELAQGASTEKARRCLALAEQHLTNLYGKRITRSDEPAEHLIESKHGESRPRALWDAHGRPLRHRVREVAAKLVRASETRLDRFETHLRYLY
jgi:hypothetical protein